jgi:type I restriction enzyme, S subunit
VNRVYPIVPLIEACTPVERPEAPTPGQSYRQIGVQLWGRGAYERETIDGGQTKYATLSRVEADDIIVNKIWARNGSVAVVTNALAGCYCSGEFPTFVPNRERLEPRWFHWITKTRSFWEQCDEKSRGTSGQNRIRPERFLEVTIPLPPLAEQRRIVARIEELAAKIEEARVLRREAVVEATGLLTAAMSLFFDFSNTRQSVGDFASVLGGYAFSSEQYVESGTHQIIRIGNVRDGYLDLSRTPVYWNVKNDNRIRKYELDEGDILISMTGTREKRDYGYIAIVPPDEPLLLNQRVGKVVPHVNILKRYLFYFLRSPFFRDHLFPNATGTANQANIGIKHIEGVPFCPHKSLEEQYSVVSYLDALQAKVDALKALQAETAAELDALLPAVLDKAFKGEL